VSGSRGPLSNPNARHLRGRAAGSKIQLPMEGWQGPIPDWPLLEGLQPELERWERLWRTPMAAQWVRMHIDTVIARYVRVALLAESFDHETSVAMANIKGEARQLESLLGLNPSALKRLEWEIVVDEVEEQREVAPARRRLKAVDPDVPA
jgi:hypothetical protein